ncbi:MAG: cardiolipin synthase [Rhodothermales bacterium]|nr:cardiolipin synthase [Rhodothermales bacterium]
MQGTPADLTIAGLIIAAVSISLSTFVTGHALLHIRRPQAAFGWIAISWVFPFGGSALYFLFGINRIRNDTLFRSSTPQPPLDPSSWPIQEVPGLEPLSRLGLAVTGCPLVAGNQVDVLHNGEEAFPAMLEAIDTATDRVYLSTYIFQGKAYDGAFVSYLERAANRGVTVCVLLDGIGELYTWPRTRRLIRSPNIRIGRFLPPRLFPPSIHANLRNHRKILIADQIAFAGGMNISQRHVITECTNGRSVVDVHFRLTGPIVTYLEKTFIKDWAFATGRKLKLTDAPHDHAGSALCRMVTDGPDDGLDQITALVAGAVSVAKKKVSVMSPYFLPTPELLGAFQTAALRGVEVCVVLPERNNLGYVHRATRHALAELLERDVRVVYQPAPFVHSKLLIVDDAYVQLGSANMDPRSLRLNFELLVEVYDSGLAARLASHFSEIESRSRVLTLHELANRPLPTKLLDGVAWLFSPYL